MSFSLGLVNVGRADFVRLDLSHGRTVELQSVGIMDDAVEDGVGEGGFADDIVPLGQRQLAGDQGGGALVTVTVGLVWVYQLPVLFYKYAVSSVVVGVLFLVYRRHVTSRGAPAAGVNFAAG